MKFIILLLMTLIITTGTYLMNKNDTKDEINFYFYQLPFSSDTMDFDYLVHHYAFASVFRPLVSIAQLSQIKPELAESWSHDGSFKTWNFKLKENLTYSNNDLITPNDILKSFKRVIYLKKMKNSHSGLFEHLRGFETINSIDFEIEGISLNGNTLTFFFDKEMPDLLQKISFGFYSLAHPSLYDQKTGEWNNKKNAISSNNYAIKEWSKENFQLELRDNLILNDNAKLIKKIIFKISDQIESSEDLDEVDVIVADKKTLLVNDNFEFSGSSNGLKLSYAQCYHLEKVNKPLGDIVTRKELRQKFYDGMRNAGYDITNSFFPFNLAGVNSFKVEDKYEVDSKKLLSKKTIIIQAPFIGKKIQENQNKKALGEYLLAGVENMRLDGKYEVITENYSVETRDKLDIIFNSTGIEADNYWDTVRFMFLSKDGIRLPDESGLIKAELKKENPDINFINQELWNQAIIWPIRHYSSGYWFNKKSNIDYSEINFDLPYIDFKFLKWK